MIGSARRNPDVSTRPDFRLFPLLRIVFFIVFFIVLHYFCAGGFSLAVARPCIVIGAHFPLQIDCILPGPLELSPNLGDGRDQAAAA
jgi:hypothetical protein